MSEDEKRRVAYHESGHALVALSVDRANPVHRVTIIPRSIGALGVTLQLPTEDRYLVTKEDLLDRICVMFGGRVAEELVCGDISTGAHDDLKRATETARQMVTRLGMSEKLGAMTFGRQQTSRFLDGQGMEERNYSEETARAIDAEIRAILEGQHRRATEILTRDARGARAHDPAADRGRDPRPGRARVDPGRAGRRGRRGGEGLSGRSRARPRPPGPPRRDPPPRRRGRLPPRGARRRGADAQGARRLARAARPPLPARGGGRVQRGQERLHQRAPRRARPRGGGDADHLAGGDPPATAAR